jgi:selenide,water dikinase
VLKLTQTVQKGGCAAKVAAVELRKILKNVKFPPRDPRVSVDGGLFDDAAIFDISHDLAMVQTLDFFTPIVKDNFELQGAHIGEP